MKRFQKVVKRVIGIPIALTILCLGASPAWTQTLTTLTIAPNATYLQVAAGDQPGTLDAPAIDLLALGVAPGDFLRLEQLGAFQMGGAFGDDATNMVGVFSSTNILGPESDLNRVTGAIDAGVDVDTGPTTDIPEDFRIDPSLIIQVPAGANYLFIAALDAFYTDNTDPNGDFAVRIIKYKVPDLSIWVNQWFKVVVTQNSYHFSDLGVIPTPSNPRAWSFPGYMKIAAWDHANGSFTVNIYNPNELGNWDPAEYTEFTFNYFAGSDLKFVCNFQMLTPYNTVHVAVLFVGRRNAQGNFVMGGITNMKTLGGYSLEIDDVPDSTERWGGSVKVAGPMVPESKVPAALLPIP